MKVGVIVQQTGAEFGGGYTFREEIYRALVSSSFKSTLEYVFVVEGETPEYLKNSRCLPLKLPVVVPLPLWKVRLYRTFPMLQKYEPETIDYPTVMGDRIENHVDVLFFSYPDFLKGVNLPVITTIWDLSHRYVPHFPELTSGGNREYRENHFQKLTLNSDFMIVGTERGRYELSLYYGVDPERTWKIPHPTPYDAVDYAKKLASENRAAEKIADRYFIYPSQFWAHKNHITLVKAWKILLENNPEFPKLIFTGSNQGNQKHVMQMVKDNGLENSVVVTGFLEREELLAKVASSISVLFPCLFGPENLPPLEAGAMGCPTILADVPGFREQMGDAAAYVHDPMDPEEWASTIESFVSSPGLRNELGEKARIRALDFTSQDFVAELDRYLVSFSRSRALWD